MSIPWAYISVGSNLGDRFQNCCQGIKALCRETDVSLISRSPFYLTKPVDYLDQDWFVNAALKIETRLDPMNLLAKLQTVQTVQGRKVGGRRFGPRVLDLDIIFYENQVIQGPGLIIPHPRMHKRRFVLQPICDIDPTIVHPVLGKDLQSLLNQIVGDDQELRQCSFDC